MINPERKRWMKPALWVLVLLPVWLRLTALPIQLWDESRLAMNALEMYSDGDWITTHFRGLPDMWNTKPPLLIWLQVVSFRLFGINEFALRLPSALAGTATCMLLYSFLHRATKNVLLAALSVLILVTSYGFIKYHHSPRTGDYDALLTLYTTAYSLSFYRFIEEEKGKHLITAIVCVTLAVLVKGVAGLFFLPGLLLYALYRRKLTAIFKSPLFYAGIAVFVVFAGGYYWLREAHNPGYLQAVMSNELGGRMFNHLDATEKRARQPFYYYDLITTLDFRFWYLFLPFGAALGLFTKDLVLRRIVVLSLTLCVTFFAVIALASNKHDWYDMPMYPFLSVLAATGICLFTTILLKSKAWDGILTRNALPLVFGAVALTAYLHILTDCLKPDPGEWAIENTSACRYLKAIYHGNEQPPADRNIVVAMNDEYQANVEWYAKVLARKNIYLKLQRYEALEPAKFVVVYNDKLFWRLEADYDVVLQRRLLGDRVRIYQVSRKR